ncbi:MULTISPECIES: hypothetical protein [Providencia]|uniref:hypothetical protein n=1 Tax=Providencia TaxID=586 RepID=UPI00197FF03B|nr:MULTISPECIES: hypothetical protein [Providencia]MBN4866932.1 hypothetical protein [Providencia stuartii]MBN4876164.1 hypothetical protein [Providencia stuartii]MBN4880946.1 hypothetical protein [Providencia stuartii]MBN4885454.1 hypothetical protein [Providencia stuartii]
MLGFISALSAAVATMILLMSVLLANVLASALTEEKNKNKNKAVLMNVDYQDKGEGAGEGEYVNLKMMKSLIFSSEVLTAIKKTQTKNIDLYCSYGHNLNLDAALTYTIYNTILIKRNIQKVNVTANSPIEDTENINTCYLKSNDNERT